MTGFPGGSQPAPAHRQHHKQVGWPGQPLEERQQGGQQKGPNVVGHTLAHHLFAVRDGQETESGPAVILEVQECDGMGMGDLPQAEDQKQEPGARPKMVGDGRVAHQGRDGSGDAADPDTQPGVTFEVQAVQANIDEKAGQGNRQGQEIGVVSQHPGAAAQQQGAPGQGLRGGDSPLSQGTLSGTLHEGVDVPVDEVVEDAARAEDQGGAPEGGIEQGPGDLSSGGQAKSPDHGNQIGQHDARLDQGQEVPPGRGGLEGEGVHFLGVHPRHHVQVGVVHDP